MTGKDHPPTLLRRGEIFGRAGGVFGMVFAQKSNHEATKDAKKKFIYIYLKNSKAEEGLGEDGNSLVVP